jgi:hypothetical protein
MMKFERSRLSIVGLGGNGQVPHTSDGLEKTL